MNIKPIGLYTKMNNSIIYALDFDGVICDSAVETAITGWKAAGSILERHAQGGSSSDD